jgi:Mn2+/Fe2+ NRAMP family transporter
LVALIPNIPQIKLLLFTQCVNGLLLPILLVAIVLLSNNKEVMGDYKNSTIFNAVAWLITILISILSLLLIGYTIYPLIF